MQEFATSPARAETDTEDKRTHAPCSYFVVTDNFTDTSPFGNAEGAFCMEKVSII